MLKKSITLSILFFVYGVTLAQDGKINITVGSPYRVIDAISKHYFYDNNEIMIIKLIKEEIIKQKFDSDLNFIQQNVF